MPSLPAGTVTFLFTDVEGSTRLLHQYGERYAALLAEHRQLVRDAVARHGGVEVDTQGDAFFVAFARAADALAAASEVQRRLETGPVRVRMGLHTGEPILTDEGYVGIDVHRAARIAAAGHGGQVLVSRSTRDLVGDDGLRNLGEHRLKDLTAPERIFQLGGADFPPLRSLNETNLPMQPTPLVGRRRELAEVLDSLRANRFVTLTGPGGSGKTRLALQAAAELVDEFPDGVWFVSLAAVTEPALVPPTIAQVVGARDDLAGFLRGRKLLLLLDNLEQLLPRAAPTFAALDACVLATSRERLHLSAEHEYPVSTLPLDDAVTLFAQRARQLKPSFEPDAHVREIARRLDGLPLALELAAARVKVLTAEQIVARLSDSLGLLTTGVRDAPERQRTLRATIEWSHDLLTAEEQQLFMRLAVFVGSFDLEAAEAVCGAALDTLESLVNKSLLRQTEEGRFFMLETIREFGVEQFDRSDEADAVRDRHAAHFLAAVEHERIDVGIVGAAAMIRARSEQPNIRAAIERRLEQGDLGSVANALLGMWVSWTATGHGREGSRLAETLLERRRELTPAALVQTLLAAGELARLSGDLEAAVEFKQELARLAPAAVSGGEGIAAGTFSDLADIALLMDDVERARDYAERSFAMGSRPRALASLGEVAVRDGKLDEAERCFAEAAAAFRDVHALNYASMLEGLGEVARRRGEDDRAAELFAEAGRAFLAVGDQAGVADCLDGFAALAAGRGDHEVAGWLVGASTAVREEWARMPGRPERIPRDVPAAAVSQGRLLSIEDALAYALQSLD